jgi:hypothetical protein
MFRDFVKTRLVPAEGQIIIKKEPDLRFSQRYSQKFKYYVILRHVDWYTVPDISRVFTAFIFRGHAADIVGNYYRSTQCSIQKDFGLQTEH